MKSLMYAPVVAAIIFVPFSARAAPEYIIEAAVDDEKFIINGELFTAQTYCLGWEKGDRVVFLEGAASGACTSATLYNRRMKETCELWCGE